MLEVLGEALISVQSSQRINWPYSNGGVPYLDLKTHLASLNLQSASSHDQLDTRLAHHVRRFVGYARVGDEHVHFVQPADDRPGG